jgi:CRISPR-associated exonuclease Cas4
MRHEQPDTIPLSFLNALEYCPRRFYYEFVQSEMIVNEFVLEGTLLHQQVDEPGERKVDGELRVMRMHLCNEQLHIAGFADIVLEQDERLIPMEYKHGKEGKWLNDYVQLCAQALCLEAQLPEKAPIPFGYIFYFGSRKRVQVDFTPALRARTLATIQRAKEIAVQERPPEPLEGKMATRCRDCSLRPICLPEEVRQLSKKGMKDVDALFN